MRPLVLDRDGLAPLPIANASEVAFQAIRQAIIDGHLAPGERLREVVTGYLGGHVDNWAHYTVNASQYQMVQRDVDGKLLDGSVSPSAALIEMKTRIDALLLETYERFMTTQLVRDTPCT